VIDRLRAAETLLVIDNCEHVAADVRVFLDRLLSEASGVRVLTTSQVRLGVAGEVTFQVEPLSLGGDGRQALEQSDAVHLFVERAQLTNPSFEVDADSRRTIARLCDKLDGLPLAIELAAARVRVLSVDEIEKRLDDRFRLLSERHSAVARHRTLRAAIDWSYDLLTAEQRCSLDQLSVFRGDFPIDAAAVVLDVDVIEAIETITDLVDRSLVQVATADAGSRYRLLETIRDYGDENLEAAGAASSIRARHREWILALASRPEAEHLGPEGPEWHDALDAEYANVLLALETAHADGVPGEALVLCKHLWLWFWLRGHLSDGREACERSLEACPDAPAADRAAALLGKGLLAFAQLDLATAGPALDEVIDLDGGGDRMLAGWGALFAAQLAVGRGDVHGASEQLRAGLAIAREIAPPGHLAGAYYWASSASVMLGDRENADRYLDLALATAREVGAPYVLTRFLPVLGKRRLVAGDEEGAFELFEEALDTSRSTRDRAGVARSAAMLAELHLERANFERAESLLEEAAPIVALEIDDQVFACKVSLALASLHRQRGAFEEAQGHLARGKAVGYRLTSRKSSTDPYREQALVDLDLGRLDAADEELALSEKQARSAGHAERLARCLLLRAEVRALLGQVDAAADILDEVARHAPVRTMPVLVSALLHAQGRVAAAANRPVEAEQAFRSALIERLRRGHDLRAVESAEGLACSLADSADLTAAQLFGAVAAERTRLNAPRPPVWVASVDRSEQTIRTKVGDTAFDEAFGEGFSRGLGAVADTRMEPELG
jgi:predicted ATPase